MIACFGFATVAHADTPEPTPTVPAGDPLGTPPEPTPTVPAGDPLGTPPPPPPPPPSVAEPVVPPTTPVVATPDVVAAAPKDPEKPEKPEDDGAPSDQGIGADLGLASGSHITPGGLRLAGHYLYKLSASDWFDGTASFTYGGGDPACFRDRSDAFLCEHGLLDGKSVEVTAAVRRMLVAKGEFRPFARVGAGLGIVRFADDDVTGFVLTLHGGAGVRAQVAPQVAVVIEADLTAGLGAFGHSVGFATQLGAAILAGAEFRLE